MTRGIHHIIRAVVGIACTAMLLKYIGVSWADVNDFVKNGIGGFFEVLKMFKGVAG